MHANHIVLALAAALSAGLAQAAPAKPAQYLIKFKDVVTLPESVRLLEVNGFTLKRRIPEISVFIATPSNEKKAVPALAAAREILYIEKDERRWRTTEWNPGDHPRVRPRVTPNDPQYGDQYGLTQVGVDVAWSRNTGSRNVVVAVSDTGVDLNHPDLAAQKWTNSGEIAGNGIDDDNNGYVDDVHGYDFNANDADPADENGHGTHCAGIIGAEGDNTQGVTGMNWRVSIMPVRFLGADGSGSTSGGVDTIVYAAKNGARVISASWGSSGGSNALKDAIDFAWGRGALVVAAAGNNSSDNDTGGSFPANYAHISVAATGQGSSLANFSNWGRTRVHVGAPGVSVLATYPPDTYKKLSGTSMATPMVSGLAALILAERPGLTVLELRNLVLHAVKTRTALANKVASDGEIDAEAALANVSGGFQLWPGKLRVLKGEKFQFSAFDAGGAVQWAADNGSASVDAAGVLTANAAGSVKVIATRAGSSVVAAVTVVEGASTPNPPGGGCNSVFKKRKSAPLEELGAALSIGLPFMAAFAVTRRRGRDRRKD